MQQKFLDNKEPVNSYLVEITVEHLKTLVARIESKLKTSEPGQCLLTPFTPNITLLTYVGNGDKQKQ
jgi:hypothetical protein